MPITVPPAPPAPLPPWWRPRHDSLPWNTVLMAVLLCCATGGYLLLKRSYGGLTELATHCEGIPAGERTGLHQAIAKHGATIAGIIGNYGVHGDGAEGGLRLKRTTTIDSTGFERLPAFTGALLACEHRIARVNRAAAALHQEIMARWRDGTGHRLLIPAGELAAGRPGVLEVPLPDLLLEPSASLARLDTLAQLIGGGAHNLLHTAATPATPTASPLADELRTIAGTWVPRPADADAAIIRELRRQWTARIAADLPPTDAANGADLPIAQRVAGALDADLHRNLRQVIDEDMGIFWLFGWLRWFEVWAWCVFGVLAGTLYHQGQFLMGYAKRPWIPRGTLNALLQLLHVPFMSLAVFWVFAYVTGSQAPLDLARSTPALLAYAFIFGIFPYTAYDLLRKATSQLRDSIKPVPGQVATAPRTVTVVAAPPTAPDQPPHLNALRERLRRIATAPIE